MTLRESLYICSYNDEGKYLAANCVMAFIDISFMLGQRTRFVLKREKFFPFDSMLRTQSERRKGDERSLMCNNLDCKYFLYVRFTLRVEYMNALS